MQVTVASKLVYSRLHLLADAAQLYRFILDDGSGQGQLYATNDMVRQAMGLSQRDWVELNEVVLRTGQLVYAKGHQDCPQVSMVVNLHKLR